MNRSRHIGEQIDDIREYWQKDHCISCGRKRSMALSGFSVDIPAENINKGGAFSESEEQIAEDGLFGDGGASSASRVRDDGLIAGVGAGGAAVGSGADAESGEDDLLIIDDETEADTEAEPVLTPEILTGLTEETEAESETAETEAESETEAKSGTAETEADSGTAETEADSGTAETETESETEADSGTAETEAESETEEDSASETARVLTVSGADYEVTLTCGPDAQIPEGSTISAREITKTSATKTYLKTAEKTLDLSTEDSQKVAGRFFDITILDPDGNEIEPAGPVSVQVTCSSDYAQALRSDPQVVHFEDGSKKKAEEVAVDDTASEETQDTVAFTTDSFSVYGIVYTVDFKLGEYAYSMAGETSMKLSALMEKLGVTDFDVQKVAKVEFTDPALLQVEKDEDGSDWTLTSLQPFQSNEKLTVTNGDGTYYEVAVTDAVVGTARDLRTFLTAATIDAPTDANGKYVVKPGKEVNVHLTFEEGANKQFNNTSLWYPIPSGLSVLEGASDDITVTVQDDGVTYTIPGNHYVVENGRLNFTWNTSDPNFSHLKAAANVEFSIDFKAKFDGKTDHIEFSDEISRDVVLDNSQGVSVNKTAGSIDMKTGEAEYTLAVTSTGSTSNIVVKDTFEGNAISLVPGSIGVYTDLYNADDSHKVPGVTVPNGDAGSFSLTIPSMTDGQTYYVKYKGKVDFSKLTKNQDGSYGIPGDTRNTATVKPDSGDGDSSSHTFNNVIAAPAVSKSAGNQSDNADGNKTVQWTINASSYNMDGIDGSLAGGTISDQIADGSTGIMKYSGTGLTVVVTDPTDNNKILETRVIPWSQVGVTDLSTATGWTYNVPSTGIDKDTRQLNYTITYTTDVDMKGKHGSVDVGNGTGTTDHDGNRGPSSSSTGTIGPLADETPGVKKSVDSISTETVGGSEQKVVTWKVDITVPATGLTAASVTDIYPTKSGPNGNRADTLSTDEDAITCSDMLAGTPDGVTEQADANTSDASKAVITFSYTKDGKTHQGLYGTGKKRTVSVLIKTVCNQNWISDADTYSYMQGHTNTANLDAEGHIYTSTAEAYPGFPPEVSKFIWNGSSEIGSTASKDQKQPSGTMDVDGVSLPYWVYRLDIKGIVAGSSITDTYDPRLVYVPLAPDNTDPKAMNGILYGGDQYNTMVGLAGDDNNPDQDYADRWVDASVSGNTVTFSIQDQNIPKHFWNGQATTNYCLLYTLRVKDAAALESLQKEAAQNKTDYYASLGNLAEYGNSKSSVDAEYKYQTIDKQLLNEGEISGTNNVGKFKITVNPNAYDLNAGSDYLTVTDTFSDSLSIDYNSIAVSPSDGVTWEVHGNTATFRVPDETAVTITYDAYIIGKGSVHISNTASVEGDSDTVDTYKTIETSGQGTASTAIINVKKHKYGEMSTPLQGAVFQLYKYKGDTYTTEYKYNSSTKQVSPALPTDIQDSDWEPVLDKHNNPVTATTNKNGVATFKGHMNNYGWVIWNDQLYALKEITPPQGYVADTSTGYWQFIVAKDGIPYYKSYIYRSNDSMRIANYPQGGILIRKDVRGISLTEDQKKAITFTIKDPAGTKTTLTYDQFVNGEYKLTEGYQTGIYTITETAKAPENYSLKTSEETSWYEQNDDGSGTVKKTSTGSVTSEDDGTKVTTTTIEVKDLTKEYTASFVNKYTSAFLKLVKTDEAGTPLAGAVFTLTKDGEAYKTVTSTASADGITFNGLQPGTYMLTETQAPEGYVKVSSPMTFTVNKDYELTWNGEVSSSGAVLFNYGSNTVTVRNKPREEKKGEIEVQKTWEGNFTDDEKTASVQLKKVPKVQGENATFKITGPVAWSQGNTIYFAETGSDKNGVTLRTGDQIAVTLLSGNSYGNNGYVEISGAEFVSQDGNTVTLKITESSAYMGINGQNTPTYEIVDLGTTLEDTRNPEQIAAATQNEGDPVTLDSTNSWYHKWTGLSTDYTYYVEEKNVPDGVEVSYTYKGETLPAAGIAQGLINVHNKKSSTAFSFTKKWLRTGTAETSAAWPEGVTSLSFTLKASTGTEYSFTVTKSGGTYSVSGLSSPVSGTAAMGADGLTVTIAGLPTGSTYSVTEKNVPDGYSADYGTADGKVNEAASNGGTITNRQTASYEIPSTGGIGTRLYFLAGMALLMLGAAMVIRRRRRV